MGKIKSSCPRFVVTDVVAAGEHYRDKLGVVIAEFWGDPPAFAMGHRDSFVVMMNQVDRKSPTERQGRHLGRLFLMCRYR